MRRAEAGHRLFANIPFLLTRRVPLHVLLTGLLAGVYLCCALLFPIPLVTLFFLAGIFVFVCLRNPYIAAVLLVIAMLFSPEFEILSGLKIRVEDAIIPLLVIALGVQACIPRFRLQFRWTRLDAAVLFLCLCNAVASLRGVLQGTVDILPALLWNAKIVELFFVYWITFNYVRTPLQVKRLVTIALVVLVALAGYTYFQIPGTQIHTVHRLTAPFEGAPEPTTLGGYLTLLLALVMSMAIYADRREHRIAWWGISGVVIVPILFTLSRTTYLACGAMVFLLACITRHRGLLLGSLLLLCISPLIMPEQIVDRVLMTFDAGRRYGLDSSSAERIDVWRKALYALKTRPVLGYGVPQPILDSQFARIIIESGLLGLMAWITVLVTCLSLGRNLMRVAQDRFHKAIGAAYVVGVAVIFVHALATITFYIVRIMEPFWLLTGIVASLNAHYLTKQEGARTAERVAS